MSGADLLMLGAGGHAKVLIEAVRALGTMRVVGLLDADATPRTVFGVPVIGNESALARLHDDGVRAAFVAIGDNATRDRWGETLLRLGFERPSIVHPAALVSPSASIGAGCAVLARAVVGADSRIEDLAVVNTAAVIEHDCRIGQAAHAAPGCVLSGGVRVGARSLVGVGAAVRPNVAIGRDAVIGAGAAVVADIPDGACAVGVPARLVGAAP
jgi:UDP-perosamine 4-acetyltransferase